MSIQLDQLVAALKEAGGGRPAKGAPGVVPNARSSVSVSTSGPQPPSGIATLKPEAAAELANILEQGLKNNMSRSSCPSQTCCRCYTGADPFDKGTRALSVFGSILYCWNWFRFAWW